MEMRVGSLSNASGYPIVCASSDAFSAGRHMPPPQQEPFREY